MRRQCKARYPVQNKKENSGLQRMTLSTRTRNNEIGQGADEPNHHDRCNTIKRSVCVHNCCMCAQCLRVQSTTAAVMCAKPCCCQHRIRGGGRSKPIHHKTCRRVMQESKVPMKTDIAASEHVTMCFQAYDTTKGSIVSDIVHSD